MTSYLTYLSWCPRRLRRTVHLRTETREARRPGSVVRPMIGQRQLIRVLLVGVGMVLGLLVGATPAEAATFHVTSLSDSGGDCSTPSGSTCTLRAASTSAPAPGDTI